MPQRPVIVSAWDPPDGGLLEGLLASLAAQDDGRLPPIRVLVPDAATGERVRAMDAPRDLRTIAADFALDSGTGSAHDALLPDLPRLIADADALIWLAPSVWVQRPGAFAVMAEAAAGGGLVAAYAIDRGYKAMATEHSPWHAHRGATARAFGVEVARQTWLRPPVEVGVFALRADAPHWEMWRQARAEALARKPTAADQKLPAAKPSEGSIGLSAIALNVAIVRQRLAVAPLPASWNWLCHIERPMWNGRQVVEPEPPFEPITILHLSGQARDRVMPLKDRAGLQYHSTLRFPLVVSPGAPIAGVVRS